MEVAADKAIGINKVKANKSKVLNFIVSNFINYIFNEKNRGFDDCKITENYENPCVIISLLCRKNGLPGFMRHFVKDMGIASQECRDRGLELEVLEQVLADCRQIEAEGHGGEGTQALIRHYPWAD